MTAWIYLGLVIMSGVGMVMTYQKGAKDMENQMMAHMYISQSEIERHRREIEHAVVEAVKTVRIENKTYVRNFKEVERENVVYRECKHSDDAFGLLNAALRGGPVPGQPDLQDKLPDGPR